MFRRADALTEPSEDDVVVDARESVVAEELQEPVSLWKVGHRLREVGIRVLVRQESSKKWHAAVEPKFITKSKEP